MYSLAVKDHFMIAHSFHGAIFGPAQGLHGATYEVTAEFDDASGLTPGTDVRMAGVKIGTVQANELDTETFMAKVTMNIQDGIEMPTDTSARIIPDGLLGGNFIALEPGGDEDVLKNGSVISFTQGSINVVDLLGRFIFSAADKAGGGDAGSGGSDM